MIELVLAYLAGASFGAFTTATAYGVVAVRRLERGREAGK